jgi:hypothetical protein
MSVIVRAIFDQPEDYQNIVLVSIYIVLWDAEIFVRADFPSLDVAKL